MIRRTLLIAAFPFALVNTADAAQIIDHNKIIIEQRPYSVEVCRDVQSSGDKTGDALKGAIIGGVIGNNLKGEENGGAIGALLGGMLGHANSSATGGIQRRCGVETRYEENEKTIYSHSSITFEYQGKTYTLEFKK